MHKLISLFALLVVFVGQDVLAVHPLPAIPPRACAYVIATPHRPDPRDPELTTPEQRCVAADTFALSNVPTIPVGVITPSGEPRSYCTIDGSTLAVPTAVDDTDPEFAASLAGATACTRDAACVAQFGDDATCEEFANDASGRSESGFVSVGPANSIAVASDLPGTLAAHSVYVRSPGGKGNVFYFSGGINRTHSLTAPHFAVPGDLPVLDITFCQAPASPVIQRYRDPNCDTLFGCTFFDCCGPHFPCAGEPNLAPLVQAPGDRISALDLELAQLIDSGDLRPGQGGAMRQRLVNVGKMLDKGKVNQACNHLDSFYRSIDQNIQNRSLNPDKADSLRVQTDALQSELGCM